MIDGRENLHKISNNPLEPTCTLVTSDVSMITNNLLVGQIVRLKSGGPRMTVTTECDSFDRFTCVWFSRNGTLSEHLFSKHALQHMEITMDEKTDVPF